MLDLKITRGDVVYVDLSGSVGHEKQGERPCLVIQNDKGNRHSPLTIVAPITDRTAGQVPPGPSPSLRRRTGPGRQELNHRARARPDD
jgi:mRNA interferase MazF